MKYCSQCGTAIEGEARFCSQCGRPVGDKLQDKGAPGKSQAKAAAKKKKKIGPFGCIVRIIFGIIVALVIFILWPVDDGDSLVFYETFDDNQNEWDQQEGAIQQGRYVVSASEVFVAPFGPEVKNGRLEGRLGFLGGDSQQLFGFLLRAGQDKKILFGINGDGEYMIDLPGSLEDLYEKTTLLTSGGEHALSISFSGRLLQFYIDQVPVADVFSGDAGLENVAFDSYAGMTSLFVFPGCEVFFDQLALYDYDRSPSNLSGKVLFAGEPRPLTTVTVFKVLNMDSLEAALVGTVLTDSSGRYALRLPEEGAYILEARGPAGTTSGRVTDLRIPGDGRGLDIVFEEAGDVE